MELHPLLFTDLTRLLGKWLACLMLVCLKVRIMQITNKTGATWKLQMNSTQILLQASRHLLQ